MIKGVLFDLDDTLYNSSEFARRARKEALKAMMDAGLHNSEEEAEKVLNRIILQKGSNYSMHFNDLVKALKGDHDPKIIATGIITYHNVKFSLLRPFPDTISSLIKLKSKGLKLGILTDGVTLKQWEKLIRLSICPFFDEVITSEEFGLGKPYPEFFEHGLSKMNLKPEEVVYIGDREDRDIIPAKSLGMKTVRIYQGKYSDIKETSANYSINSLSELPDLLENM
ncbi:TIGR02253 family HAD-type hydrolase [Methanococcus voltae]|uniref:Glyceraldehyde 3-phosphate phosphatase n=1 Tax=Methanococcus voltae PS TaxID=523842 RepID=A0ABT2EV79_METVO|nr:TIGR02253 family HAD-type hydrolase [Methanococcus voltae]MBP2171946.1 putative hydrolase of the HAD superfamily [Methanococcus voltae]MCS3921822.1 putative hydrolase of the HAD superfamily [Methanococcus voltae PS]